MSHAEQFSTPLLSGLSASEWPWWIHRIASYVATVRGIHERAHMLDVEVPPRHIWWDTHELDDYFERAKKDA